MTPSRYSRRTILLGTAITAVSAAGCLESSDDGDPADGSDSEPVTGTTEESEDDLEASDNPDDGSGEPLKDPEEPSLAVTEVATGLSHPWAITVLPEDGLLVTERGGRLVWVDPDSGDVEPIEGVPEVYAEGQGGLLDVELGPDFVEEPWIYLTYAAETGGGESATHLGRAQFEADAMTVEDFEELYVADAAGSNGHYGSRAVFGEEGMLYVTVGDRQAKEFGPDHVAQDLGTDLGTTLRLHPDGTVPEDNPFVSREGVQEAIYSYGHRNPQAMAIHPETGEIWQAEHGEEDGDEINRLEAGGNYGWPVATYACEYGTDDPIGDRPNEREGTVEPVHYWECGSGGFPPSGAAFYDSAALPWQGDLLVGNLANEYLGRFSVEGAGTENAAVEERDPLLADHGWRVRDIAVGGSGVLYVTVDAEDAPVVQIAPA